MLDTESGDQKDDNERANKRLIPMNGHHFTEDAASEIERKTRDYKDALMWGAIRNAAKNESVKYFV
jgi:hypothetical protein